MQSKTEPGQRRIKIKRLWIAVLVLALLSPLGLLIPALFGAGGAWGEWGLEEIRKMLGFVPEGMRKLGHLWSSPMKDYAVPGQSGGIAGKGLGYLASALVGAAIAAALAFLLARVLGKRNRGD